MQAIARALCLSTALLVSACGGPEQAESDTLGTQSQTLTTGTSQGCTFTISSALMPGGGQPQYAITLTRAASSTCAWGAASVQLGTSYNVPTISLAANALGVATGFSFHYSPSPRGNTQCSVKHIRPDDLSTARDTLLVVNFGAGNVNACNLSIASNGTTLYASGTKTGPLAGETGSGSNYTATYLDFFTSTTAPTYAAY
ncbi:MAG: hypothetical protein EOO71_00225 [Myxococcaceae bacterium]|nr:MAG: hypothetical protein EOO71_00225 [Myxococcaceae bacterium]